jgi:hypothetical protein
VRHELPVPRVDDRDARRNGSERGGITRSEHEGERGRSCRDEYDSPDGDEPPTTPAGTERRARRRHVQRRVLSEHAALELLQGSARLQTELVAKPGDAPLIGGERIGLSTRSIEREHELLQQVLAEGMLGTETFDLRHDLPVAAERQVGVDPCLVRVQDALLKESHLRHSPRLELQIGERRTPHKAECLAEQGGRLLRVGCSRLPHEAVEPFEVGLTLTDDELVATLTRRDPVAAERTPEVGDVHLHTLGRVRRRVVRPDRLDEAIRRDRMSLRQKEHGEKRPLFGRAERDRPAVVLDLERAE